MSRTAVRLESVSRTFRRGGSLVRAVREVTLAIPQGALIAMVGPSGSGKTTLLNLIGGLERPDAGRISRGDGGWGGGSERELSRYRRAHVGFVFQHSNLISDLTARENIELPLLLTGVRRSQRRGRVDALLGRLELKPRAAAFPSELSGGERQRVALARAVAHRPGLLLADEPTASLDSVTAQEVVNMLRRLKDEESTTVVMATHDPQISCLADMCVRLLDGQLEEVFVGAE
jgi:putative ABC transport system ATP-binding protein